MDHWASAVLGIEHTMADVMLRYNELKAELASARGRHRQAERLRHRENSIVDVSQKAQLQDSTSEAEPESPAMRQAASKAVAAPAPETSRNGLRCSSRVVCLREPSPLCPLNTQFSF